MSKEKNGGDGMKRMSWIMGMILALCVMLAGCSGGTTAGGSATGSSDIEISGLTFGFVRAEDYDPETFDIENAAQWTTLDVDTEYYLFLTLDIQARRDNDGQSLLNIKITFDSLDILEGTMEDVSTGMIETMTFQDANTGNIGKSTTVSFKIPSLSAEPKKINMIVSLQPIMVGESHIIIGYDYDAPSQYRLLGDDGYTKNLTIQHVKIEAPVLDVTEMGDLTWKHVKNADYYCIFESGSQEPLTDGNGDVIYVRADNTSVGSEIIYNIGQYISGYHMLVVRAFSNNSNILSSDNSNILTYTW